MSDDRKNIGQVSGIDNGRMVYYEKMDLFYDAGDWHDIIDCMWNERRFG